MRKTRPHNLVVLSRVAACCLLSRGSHAMNIMIYATSFRGRDRPSQDSDWRPVSTRLHKKEESEKAPSPPKARNGTNKSPDSINQINAISCMQMQADANIPSLPMSTPVAESSVLLEERRVSPKKHANYQLR